MQSRVAFADDATVDRAVRAAKRALAWWSRTTLGRRAEILFAFRSLVGDNALEMAQIVSSEHGKIVTDAEGELARALEVIDYACSLPELLKGHFIENGFAQR